MTKKISKLLIFFTLLVTCININDKITSNYVDAATGNKFGLVKKAVVPKAWRGKWAWHVKFTKHNLSLAGNNPYWIIGKVQGTNKYPWQMPKSWKKSADKYYLKRSIATMQWTHFNGQKCAKLIDSNNGKAYNYVNCHYEQIGNNRYQVLFYMNAHHKVMTQTLRTEALQAKYYAHKFSDMQYYKNW